MSRSRLNPGPDDARIRVLNAVLLTGKVETPRKALADVAGVSFRNLMNVIRDLHEHGVLERRPLRLGPGCGLVLSFALGSESLRCGLVDANGALTHQDQAPALAGQLELSPDKLFERMRILATKVMTEGLDNTTLHVGGRRALRMLGVNVAWPCPIDRLGFTHGRILSHNDWHHALASDPARRSLADRIALALGAPFSEHTEYASAINDANADALTVAFDHARTRAVESDESDGPRVIITVRIGGGLGAAIIELAAPRNDALSSFIDARLMVGTNGYAGELGHLPISAPTVKEITKGGPHGLAPIDFENWSCSCGGHGHLEALASGMAFARRMEASGYELTDAAARFKARTRELIRDSGDARAQRALQDCGRLIGRALANPVLMFDPHTVVLTGFFADEQVKRGIERERGIWGSTIGDTVTIECLEGDEYAYNAVRGAGLAVIRDRVMRELPRLLRPEGIDEMTFLFEDEHLHAMVR
jgi:predicted NBD/HSP70 family sugar kinase